MAERKSEAAAGKPVIIVESPAKTRTIRKILGDGYVLLASLGHVRDLPEDRFGVAIEEGFRPTYEILPSRRKVVRELKEKVRGAKEVYLASDPDREGEAIAWHLTHALGLKDPKRIEFHEITEPAVKAALRRPRGIDMNRVNAQQARRILDRIVGYILSPLISRKRGSALSAGRVQSVAVRLICDREREIEAFVPQEYWLIAALLTPDTEENAFRARLEKWRGKQLSIPNEEEARRILAELQGATYVVAAVHHRDRPKQPPLPFITSTLQREAAQRLGFPAAKTMRIAQELYEGVELGEEGAVGLITYMRTDSPRVSEVAQEEARRFIAQTWGEEYLPPAARKASKAPRHAQEAHEAIRPTSVLRRPEDVQPFLNRDQHRLYRLIWERFVASQMAPALLHVVTVEIQAGEYLLRAQGETVVFPGYLVLREEAERREREEEGAEEDVAQNRRLPEVQEGQVLRLLELMPQQKFTQPPPRYTEASLVKALEEKGIGRPSTYAQILTTILQRGYVVRDGKHLRPTDLGRAVTEQLVKFFPTIMDVQFTARMEEELDAIEQGKQDWQRVLEEFYQTFSPLVKRAEREMGRIRLEPKPTEETCPQCGAPLVERRSRYGPFLACSGYPRCTYTRDLRAKEPSAAPQPTGLRCEECGGEMLLREGRRGKFLGCSNYPRCKNTKPLEALEGKEETLEAPSCPQCGRPMALKSSRHGRFWACTGYPECKATKPYTRPLDIPCPKGCGGQLEEKHSRKGLFYGCNRYPDCDFATWYRPLPERLCPRCGAPLGERQNRQAKEWVCLLECGYSETASEEMA